MASALAYRLGRQDYRRIWTAMSDFTDRRDAHTPDQFWLVEHPPVYTQGQAGKPEHLLAPGEIPVVQTDRGGQVTYHGPGQLVVYPLLNLRRLGLGVRDLVTALEAALVDWLADQGVTAEPRPDAPGVYVDGAKIAAIGLRVRRGCSFHGLSLNLAMDLEPFSRINPCGYQSLPVTQLSALVADMPPRECIETQLLERLGQKLGVKDVIMRAGLPPGL